MLKSKETVISEIEIPKVGVFYLVFPDENTQREFKHYIAFIPTNITIDGKDNHRQKI